MIFPPTHRQQVHSRAHVTHVALFQPRQQNRERKEQVWNGENNGGGSNQPRARGAATLQGNVSRSHHGQRLKLYHSTALGGPNQESRQNDTLHYARRRRGRSATA